MNTYNTGPQAPIDINDLYEQYFGYCTECEQADLFDSEQDMLGYVLDKRREYYPEETGNPELVARRLWDYLGDWRPGGPRAEE